MLTIKTGRLRLRSIIYLTCGAEHKTFDHILVLEIIYFSLYRGYNYPTHLPSNLMPSLP